MNAHVTMFMGRPTEYWAKLNKTMQEHNIDSPAQLDGRLTRLTKEQNRVDVYDKDNCERLLGSVPKPDMRGPYYQMLVHPGMPSTMDYRSPYHPGPRTMETVKTIRMEASTRRGPNPLDVTGVLVTTDPLDALMHVHGFRLPGESEEDACRRRNGW